MATRRSTTVRIARIDCVDEESTRLLIRSKVQPWLDELAKDGVEYNGMSYMVEDDIEAYLNDDIVVTVSVDVKEESA